MKGTGSSPWLYSCYFLSLPTSLPRLYPLPDDLLQYPALAHQYTLAGVTPHKPHSGATLDWGEAVMSVVEGLVGRGEGGKVMARIDPSGDATLFCVLGETKVRCTCSCMWCAKCILIYVVSVVILA